MLSASRKVAFVLLAALAIVATGCGASNNKGKIVGKWKIVSAPGMDEKELKGMMELLKAYPYMEFKEDGSGTFGVESSDPDMQKMLAGGKEKTAFAFKYKLLSGDNVELYDLPKEMQEKGGGGPFGKKDKARGTVKITGDDMTVTDDETKDKPMKLTKLK